MIPPTIDIDSYPLEALLMIALRLGLIRHFEVFASYVLLEVGEETLAGRHEEARAMLQDLINDWWQEEPVSEPPAGSAQPEHVIYRAFRLGGGSGPLPAA